MKEAHWPGLVCFVPQHTPSIAKQPKIPFCRAEHRSFWRIGLQGSGTDSARFPWRKERLGKPRQKTGAQESSGSRVAFLLVPFLWRRKEMELVGGGETPHSTHVA
jgi:hypothetical protein